MSARRRRSGASFTVARAALFPLLGCSLLGCQKAPSGDVLPDAGVSPQAHAEPVPLEMAMTSSAQPLAPDAGPPPAPLRADEVVAADSPSIDLRGWELEAVLRTADVPPPFRGPETSIGAIDAAKKKNEARLTIDFTPARLLMTLGNRPFVLPTGTELRARSDRYGHFVLLPGSHQIRVAAPGSLRTLFEERRIDVEPLVVPSVTERGEGGRRLGFQTHRVEVTSRVATATFELARVEGVGEGGALVCRTLLDLMNAPPSSAVCGYDDVPLHVEWRWATKGTLFFDAVDLTRHVDLAPSSLAAPPAGDDFTLPALPELRADPVIDPAEVLAFRTAAGDIGTPDASAGPTATLSLANGSDQLRLAYLDGVPVAWLAPGGRFQVTPLLRGRYGFEWRTFLGDAYDPPTTIDVPSSQRTGAVDAGTP